MACRGTCQPSERAFDQQEFLQEHIPYRLQLLEAGFHSLMLLRSLPAEKRRIQVDFENGHRMVGGVAILTNAWLESGLMACRSMRDFLLGNGKRYTDAVTVDMFHDTSGAPLSTISDEDLAACDPNKHPCEFVLESIRRAKLASDKAVAHLSFTDVRSDDDAVRYQVALEAVREAVLVYLYDRLRVTRPSRAITFVWKASA